MGDNVQKQIERIKSSQKISKKNKELILTFVNKCYAHGLSQRRVAKLLWIIRTLAEKIDFDFDKATREQIEELVAGINQSSLSEWTKSDYKKTLKKFYKVMFSEDGLETPKIVRWIGTKIKDRYQEKKRLQRLIRPEHVEKLVEAAPNMMYKALIKFMFETGARISEIIGDPSYPETGIRIKDITWDGDMPDVILTGKTGTRVISIYDSVPLMAAWYNQHPCKNNQDAFFFTTRKSGERINYTTVVQMLKELGQQVCPNIDVNPHAFRRASITYYSDFLTSAQLSQKYGLVPNSDVIRHYMYRKPDALKKAIRKMHGLEEPENNMNATKPKRCPRCHELADSWAKQCLNCGLLFDAAWRIDYRKKERISLYVLNKLWESNPELKDMIEEVTRKFEKEIRVLIENGSF